MTKSNQHIASIARIAIVWVSIVLLVGFFVATKSAASPVTMSVMPEVPKTGEPVIATFSIANPYDEPLTTSYWLYVNGKLVEDGSTIIGSQSSAKYLYASRNRLERGEQVNFVLKTTSGRGSVDKAVSMPPYPSQLMSSFVSFAAFSTSVMSSLVAMEYFTSTFGTTGGLNVGIIICIVLISLLIFLELTQAIVPSKGTTILGTYRARFKVLTTILFIILMGMVFTRVVIILAT